MFLSKIATKAAAVVDWLLFLRSLRRLQERAGLTSPPKSRIVVYALLSVGCYWLIVVVVGLIAWKFSQAYDSTIPLTVAGIFFALLAVIFAIETNPYRNQVLLVESFTRRMKKNTGKYGNGYEETEKFLKKVESQYKVFHHITLASHLMLAVAAVLFAILVEGALHS